MTTAKSMTLFYLDDEGETRRVSGFELLEPASEDVRVSFQQMTEEFMKGLPHVSDSAPGKDAYDFDESVGALSVYLHTSRK